MSSSADSVEAAEFRERFEQAIRADGRYAPEAFEFLHQGLENAASSRYGEFMSAEPRHVTGQELCHALRELAQERWGLLAPEVLRRWNIHRTRDFGEMVYLMISLKLMGKQDSDKISDFDEVYDFSEAFGSYRLPIDAEDLQGERN